MDQTYLLSFRWRGDKGYMILEVRRRQEAFVCSQAFKTKGSSRRRACRRGDGSVVEDVPWRPQKGTGTADVIRVQSWASNSATHRASVDYICTVC